MIFKTLARFYYLFYILTTTKPSSSPTYPCVSILDVFICRAYVPQSSKIGCFPFPHAVSIYTSLGFLDEMPRITTFHKVPLPYFAPPSPVYNDIFILTWIWGHSSFISDVAFTTFRYRISILVDYFLILLGDIFSQRPDLIAGKKI